MINIPKTLYFNFKYLPFRQAVKLPIYCHDVIMDDMRGGITIDSPNIRRGMISLGKWGVKIFHDKKFIWSNHGGGIIFRGKCQIGAGSALVINDKSHLIFGDNFKNAYGMKIVASRKIEFGKHVSIGWNVLIMDTNFHPLKNKLTGLKSKGGAPITIGDYNWISTNSVILPGVTTPQNVIFALGSIVNKGINWDSFSLYGGSPLHKLRDNIYRDYNDDRDEYAFQKRLE